METYIEHRLEVSRFLGYRHTQQVDLVSLHLEALQASDLKSARHCVGCSHIVASLRELSRQLSPLGWLLHVRRVRHFQRVVQDHLEMWCEAAMDPTRAQGSGAPLTSDPADWLDMLHETITDAEDW